MRWMIALLCLLLAACGAAERSGAVLPPPTGAPLPTLMPPPSAAPPGATVVPEDSGWLPSAPGVELRRLRVAVGDMQAPVSVVRLDPQAVHFSVGYQPAAPPTLSEWVVTEGALALINGGFFDEAGETVALLIQAGQPIGESYVGRGGMFAVSPAGEVSLRALADTPFDPEEPLAEALQGWPLLVRPGGAQAYSYEDGARARRSAVALDRSGRVLFIACPTSAFTLAELSAWLAAADLDVDAAVNLDGGSSTGLLLRSAAAPERVEPFVALPIVLMALPK
jgi:hypothetical protein